jgi:hypothetical protein
MLSGVSHVKKSPLRLLLVGAVCLSILDFLFLSFFPLKDFDTWWLLSAGREMIRSRSLLTTDIFTCTIYGRPWMNKYIPFEILIYSIFSALGPNGLIALRSLLVLLSLLLSFLPVFAWRKRGDLLHVPLIGTALLIPCMGMILSRRMIVRPELFSLVFFTASVFLWEAYRERTFNPWFWIFLLLVQLLWTNFHGGFFMAFLLASFYVLERCIRRKNLLSVEWSVVPALILISIINPYGYNLHKGVIKVMLTPQYRRYIMEWHSLFRSDYSPFHMILIIVMVFATFAGMLLNMKKLRIAHVCLFVSYLILTVQSRRHAVFLCLFLPVINIWNYGCWHDTRGERIRQGKYPGYIPLALLWIFLLLFNVGISSGFLYKWGLTNGPFGFGIDRELYPWASANFMESQGIQGNILSRYRDGGYLIWRLAPRIRPCLDGRAEPFPLSLMERFWKIYTGEEIPDDFCREYDISLALIDYEDEHLLIHFKKQREWGLCFLGFREVLFLKRTPGNEKILNTFEIPLSLPISEETRKRFRLPSPRDMAALSPYSDYKRLVQIRIYLMKTLGIVDPKTHGNDEILSLIFGNPNPD